jgi:outer membrane biosynthesis protein TonB
MIPRILVPKGARLPDVDVPSTRRRPSSLDERTLVPNTLPIVQLDGHSTIPSNLPLESIATRVVVPRDVNVEMVQRRDESNLPAQPTDMDERITVPQGAMPPDEIPQMGPVSEELVEPDIIQTGELSFLPPERASQRPLKETLVNVGSVIFHILLVLFLIFEPKIFGPHVRTGEEEEIARRQMTVLLPPGALDSLKPSPRPAPHQPVNVDPRIIRKVAPTPKIEPPPTPTPTPEPPKKELPSVPAPQPNAVAPAPKADTPSRGDLPKSPPKLETPDMPVPEKGLILPKQGSPGDTIRDAARNTGRINTPVPMGGGGPLPGGGRAQGGGGRGTAGAGIDLLTDTQGVNFDDYLRRVYLTVKQNWYSVMPASVSLGDQGVVSLQFKIMRDGSVPDDDPRQVFGSGKEPLDRAAVSSIRGSNPFQPLPSAFKGPYIELRFTYYYNLPVPQH